MGPETGPDCGVAAAAHGGYLRPESLQICWVTFFNDKKRIVAQHHITHGL